MLNSIQRFSHPLFLAIALSAPACAQTSDTDPVEIIQFQAPVSDGVIAGEIHTSGTQTPDTVIIVSGGSGVGVRTDTSAAIGLFLNENTAVAIYDRRGFGSSAGEPVRPGTENSAWLIPALGQDLAAIADHLSELGYDRVGLMGSSMGGLARKIGYGAVSLASGRRDREIPAV